MRRPLYLAAGVAGHLLAVLPMVYFVGFLANLAVPKSVDSGGASGATAAMAIDLALVAAFGAVHSALARPAVQRRLASIVPHPLERTLYSMIAGLQIVALMAFWRPLPEPVWSVGPEALRGFLWFLYALAWAVVLWALRAVDDTHLFGLRQALAGARGVPYEPPPFLPRGPYRHVRHPLYSATVAALCAAPDMSRGRLLLAVALTLYIAIGTRFEERDLERRFGGEFLAYRAAVPGFLPTLPFTTRRAS